MLPLFLNCIFLFLELKFLHFCLCFSKAYFKYFLKVAIHFSISILANPQLKNDKHFRFTRIHLVRYRVLPLLENKTLKSFKESVCVSRDNFQVLRQNCSSVSLYDTTWDKITNVLYSYRPNLQVKRQEAGSNTRSSCVLL